MQVLNSIHAPHSQQYFCTSLPCWHNEKTAVMRENAHSFCTPDLCLLYANMRKFSFLEMWLKLLLYKVTGKFNRQFSIISQVLIMCYSGGRISLASEFIDDC